MQSPGSIPVTFIGAPSVFPAEETMEFHQNQSRVRHRDATPKFIHVFCTLTLTCSDRDNEIVLKNP